MTKWTAAQALVEGMVAEGVEIVFGLFGHGNVQLGHALHGARDRLRFITVRNEQAGVHAAAAYAWMTGRPQAVTTSVGPGATNLVTGAACARINRWPVLLLPGEVFAENVGPVLQQLESTIDATVNEALRPVSRYWTRVSRGSRLRRGIAEAFDAMLTPGDEGPATLCLPMDVQAETVAIDRERFLAARGRRKPRVVADGEALAEAAKILAGAKRPLIVAGGGVLRSGAIAELIALAEHLHAPIAPTQAGKGCVVFDHPLNAFGVGPTGSKMGNHLAARADVVLGIGTRYADFTTASETAYAPNATFINVNIHPLDAGKQRALRLWGDAKATLAALLPAVKAVGAPKRDPEHAADIAAQRKAWVAETDEWLRHSGAPLRQSRVIGEINTWADAKTTIVSAAGTLPGDLQKLWRDKDPDGHGYLCEYGFSTMGFEIAAGLGCKLARPDRRIAVLIGDLSFLMMSSELVTAVELGVAFTTIVFDNGGGQSIRSLQRGHGLGDHGMEIRKVKGGERVALDFAQMAEGMGCRGIRVTDVEGLKRALAEADATPDRPTVIDVKVDPEDRIGGTGGWWDVPQPELDAAGKARPERAAYETAKKKQVIR